MAAFTCTARVQQQSQHPHATRGENNMSRWRKNHNRTKKIVHEREVEVPLNVHKKLQKYLDAILLQGGEEERSDC